MPDPFGSNIERYNHVPGGGNGPYRDGHVVHHVHFSERRRMMVA